MAYITRKIACILYHHGIRIDQLEFQHKNTDKYDAY